MAEDESIELTYLVSEFKRLKKDVEKREQEWREWVEKMEAYMSQGLFGKKYKDGAKKRRSG
jgi:hypothetical protein